MSGGVRQNADKCEERFPDMQLFIKLELTRPVKTSELNGADSRVQGLGRAYQGRNRNGPVKDSSKVKIAHLI